MCVYYYTIISIIIFIISHYHGACVYIYVYIYNPYSICGVLSKYLLDLLLPNCVLRVSRVGIIFLL